MTRKLGDVALAITFLLFLIGGFSYVFIGMDTNQGVSSDFRSDLGDLENNLSGVSTMQAQYLQSVTNTSDLTREESQEISSGLESSGSLLGLFNKNVLSRFFNSLAKQFGIPSIVIAFVVGLFALTILILTVRFFFGEGKI